jgi:multidrug efflux pump subunit AcrB
MRLPKLAIENHQFTIILIVGLTLLGLRAIFTMPRSEDPAVNVPSGNVIAIYPGATGEDMEKLVVEPIEKGLNELDDVDRITTSIESGLAVITISFDFDTDLDKRFSEVKETVNGLKDVLPQGLAYLESRRHEMSETSVAQLALYSDSTSYHNLFKKAEEIKEEIEQISSVKKVDIVGKPDEVISIEVDFEKLKFYGISLQNIENAIKSFNVNIPGGSVSVGKRTFNVQTSGSYQSIEDIKHTIITAISGSPLYLKDVAKVTKSYRKQDYFVRYNSTKSLIINVKQKDKTDIFLISNRLKEIVKKRKETLDQNTNLIYAFNQGIDVEKRISDFSSSLFQGVVLVGFVILLMVGTRASMIIMLAIPLSFISGIGFVGVNGFGLQQMTIAGLVIALGLLVDNAIVVTENIHVFIKKGYSGKEAAIKATQQVAWPIISSTTTIIFAFLPIMLMQNESGDFIRSMPATVVFTLLSSLLISLTLTPFLASRFFGTKETNKENKLQKFIRKFIEIEYKKRLAWSLKNGKLLLISAFSVLFLSILFAKSFIGVSMFPKAEKNQFLINLEMPKNTNLEETKRTSLKIEEILKNDEKVNYFFTNIGKSHPQVHYAHQVKNKSKYFTQFLVENKNISKKEKKSFLKKLQTNLQNEFPLTKIEVKEFTMGPPKIAPIEIKIIGDDLNVLKKISNDFEEIFNSVSGVINISNPSREKVTDIYVNINKEKAITLGVPLHEIDKTIRIALSGMKISQFRDPNGDIYDIDLNLESEKSSETAKMTDFDNIYVSSLIGEQIPLIHLANIEFRAGKSKIEHFNLKRAVSVTSDIEGRTANEVTLEILKKIDSYNFPSGYSYFVGGEKESQEKAFGGLTSATLLAMVFIFVVLVLQFKSFRQPLIVFSAIPMAIVGSVIALYLSGNTFSFTAFVGLTSLVGIVVNNSILLVEYSNELLKSGKSLLESVQEAAVARFTPIVMTSGTTVGGLLPLTLFGGEMWAPMGWTIIGGLLASTLLTLLVVPVLYKLFTREEEII